jgi:Holliday junction resolvase
MAATPEKKVKDKVVKILKESNTYYFYASTHGFGRSGIPDLVCCVNGKFLAIEVKAGKNKPTALQEIELAAIQAQGGIAIVVNEDNVEAVRTIVRLLRETSDDSDHTQLGHKAVIA